MSVYFRYTQATLVLSVKSGGSTGVLWDGRMYMVYLVCTKRCMCVNMERKESCLIRIVISCEDKNGYIQKNMHLSILVAY